MGAWLGKKGYRGAASPSSCICDPFPTGGPLQQWEYSPTILLLLATNRLPGSQILFVRCFGYCLSNDTCDRPEAWAITSYFIKDDVSSAFHKYKMVMSKFPPCRSHFIFFSKTVPFISMQKAQQGKFLHCSDSYKTRSHFSPQLMCSYV